MTAVPKNIVIVGSSGAMGSAFKSVLLDRYPTAHLHCFSRNGDYPIDYKNEETFSQAADIAAKKGPLDLVIVVNGILHDNDIQPEKSLKDLSAEKFQHLFKINTITPALVAKHFLPKLHRHRPVKFAALSARVGSISDNQIGGWYAYRASKTALNMIIKNFAIEIGRQNHEAVIVSLHPGTVDSNLSKPFQKNIPDGKLFSPLFSAHKLIDVLGSLTPEDTGKCFAWDGTEIAP